ncbi:hypothetical protein MO973_17085 [Paenibacillus sp. TRM 82003]|uniref:hypothetical protein n=1 Tax=Kineococcus sp. TRM81007 TaxID=2925831 RepID=UPI001F59750A|nr:hypothetical protein [Kineococcus sp. TRM81007]MCI2238539.1 hypothetical protein [Kineococcus sp. TRM81007]MCI3921948.1 hypothetical protein [Paenibacillus sp. TRM 82003]
MRILRGAMALVGAACLTLTSAPAQAAPVTDLRVSPTATSNARGTSVTWTVTVTCPRGTPFTVDALLSQYDTSAPWYDGGDLGVRATADEPEASGLCRGRPQRVRFRLPVVSDEDSPFWPIMPSRSVVAFATLSAGDAEDSHCSGPACADEDQPRVAITGRPTRSSLSYELAPREIWNGGDGTITTAHGPVVRYDRNDRFTHDGRAVSYDEWVALAAEWPGQHLSGTVQADPRRVQHLVMQS